MNEHMTPKQAQNPYDAYAQGVSQRGAHLSDASLYGMDPTAAAATPDPACTSAAESPIAESPTAPSHPAVLTTEEDYENAPEGTIVASDFSDPWVKDFMGFWLGCGEGGGERSRWMALSARRVLRWGETLLPA